VEQALPAVELADVVEGLVIVGGDVDALPVGLDRGVELPLLGVGHAEIGPGAVEFRIRLGGLLEAVDRLVELLALEVLGAGVVELHARGFVRRSGHHLPPAIFLRISPVVTEPTSRRPRRTYAPRAPAWQSFTAISISGSSSWTVRYPFAE